MPKGYLLPPYAPVEQEHGGRYPRDSGAPAFMFIMYINDLLMLLPTSCVLAYADNISLEAQGQTESVATQVLQSLVNQVIDWSITICFNINATKSKWMVISPVLRPSSKTANSPSELLISSSAVERISELLLLGIMHTDNLSWHAHTDVICMKVNCVLGAIRHAGITLPM